MRLCQPHWGQLKEALTAARLLPYLAVSPEDLTAKLEAHGHEGGATLASFEPEVGAFAALCQHCVTVCGEMSQLPRQDGADKCPVCYMAERHNAEYSPRRQFDDLIQQAVQNQSQILAQLKDASQEGAPPWYRELGG